MRAWWETVRIFGRMEGVIEAVVLGHVSADRLARGKERFPGHVLYHFQASPFALKVRRELARQGLAIPMRDILEDPVAQADLVERGGRDRVPCLMIPEAKGERWLYESDEIVSYLSGRESR